MSDILLTVGVDAENSLNDFQAGINSLVGKINASPPKIKVAFDIDNAELNKLRQQIKNINSATGTSTAFNGINTAASSASAEIGNLTRQVSVYNGEAQKLSSVTSTYKNSMSGVSTTVKQVADAQGNLATKTTKVTEAFKESSQTAKNSSINIKSAESVSKSYYDTLSRLEKALRNFSAAENSNNASSRTAYSNIQNQVSAMKALGGLDLENAENRIKVASATTTANAALSKNTNILRQNGDATQTLSQRMGGLASKFSAWLTVSQMVMYAVNGIRNMISASIELDTAMTELKKVTDETDATYNKFLDNAEVRAKTIGASLIDIVSSTADFARLGYSIDEASSLADAATVYKNVGDDLADISQASESIIATMQAFGINADDAMSIVDKFNEVGNNYAISSGGIGEALLRSAASLDAANNTLDESIGLITAANTVVQDPEKVGGFAPNNTVMYCRQIAISVKGWGQSRPRKDFVIYISQS